MPAAAAFEDVLDERLGEALPSQTFGSPARGAATAVAYGFFFVDACTPAMPADIVAGPGRRRAAAPPVPRMRDGVPQAATSRSGSAHPARDAELGGAPAGTRCVRRLSRREREALHVLVTLGARLDLTFTRDDVRAAFRALALRYHPDRHPGCSDADRTRLAMLFGHAREAYRVLLQSRC
jgi:hypothetical protein